MITNRSRAYPKKVRGRDGKRIKIRSMFGFEGIITFIWPSGSVG